MRWLKTVRKRVPALACATAFLFGAPRIVRGPQPPVPQGISSCRLMLGGKTPVRLEPHECWHSVASWYGSQLQGQPTADGSIFNMYAATAAHRSLPLGSVVRISNPSTGRSMVVTINDRGPYVPGRGLDVSYEVARLLGFAQQGVCQVEIELLRLPGGNWLPENPQN